METYTSTAAIDIQAPIAKVWDGLMDPALLKQYMFGADVTSDWKEGSSIIWKGEMNGKPYEDTGTILELIPEKVLSFSHYSPMSGPDIPENHHTLSYTLTENADMTHIVLTQDNNKTEDEMKHSAKMWQEMLETMKKLLE